MQRFYVKSQNSSFSSAQHRDYPTWRGADFLLFDAFHRTRYWLFLKKHDFQGTALVARGNDVVYTEGFGLASRELQVSNIPETVFRIGSITKTFTAVAIMQLQEQKLLNVQDSIDKYIPDYPEGDKITIHHLLSHTSGIPSITNLPEIAEIQLHPSTPTLAISYSKNLPLEFTPGSDCKYNDSGYIMLGAIIEAITHGSYKDYLRDNIFRPAGLQATYFEQPGSIIPQAASGYLKEENGNYVRPGFIDMSLPHAAGSLASTVGDLHRFLQALLNGTLLSSESRQALFTIQGSSIKNLINYGYGFRVGPSNKRLEGCQSSIVGHFGHIEGFGGVLIHYRDDGLTIILLTNEQKADLVLFHKEIAAIVHSYWQS